VSITVVITMAVVFFGRLLHDSRLAGQDAQGQTPPTSSIVMRIKYPGGASGDGKLTPAPNIAVFRSSSSSGAPPSSPNRTLG
jgi:hypothetical protein